MIRNNILTSMTIVIFLCSTSAVWAGKLYRYKDDNGEIGLTRTLPPSAAQRGYDVLDDKSMRVIEHVAPALTEAELDEMERQAAAESEKRKQAEIEAQRAEEERKQQNIYDRTLLTTYETEADLLEARDKLIYYRKAQIRTHKAKLPDLEAHLYELQKQAANRELSGRAITENMQKRLDAAQQEIDLRHQAIEELEIEITELQASYAKDLERLQQLLGTRP